LPPDGESMSAGERRVRAALSFARPDRIPRYDCFWPEWETNWRTTKGFGATVSPEDYYGIDLSICAADETPWPSRARRLGRDGDGAIDVDGWGRTMRTRCGAMFSENLSAAVASMADMDSLAFESPLLPSRYARFLLEARAHRPRRAVFAKTGGPFLRTAFIRGEAAYLTDLAGDEGFARQLTARVAAHITAIGVESLRLAGSLLAGIWIYDDVAANAGPMISPRVYERIFQPLMADMVTAYRRSGAEFVIFHCDGNIVPLLPMLVEAGIDGIQPCEPKAGMDAVAIRAQYGDRLAIIGCLDNAFDLPSGDRGRIDASLRRLLPLGRDGGLILGSHSIGPDISVDTYEYLIEIENALGEGHTDGF
jgi:uroporphyrinogen decarboxylase